MTNDLFIIKPAGDWLTESRPAPKRLFGDFWLEGEMAVLFADTGKGKSMLGVQIAESIAPNRTTSQKSSTLSCRNASSL